MSNGEWQPMPRWHPAFWLLGYDLRRREFEDIGQSLTFWMWGRSRDVARAVLFSMFAPPGKGPGGRKAKI